MVADKILTHATTINDQGQTLENQAIAIHGENILWAGDETNLPEAYLSAVTEIEDCGHNLVTPGLIDCHSHVVYAGSRHHEFKLRLEGTTYAEIAKAGGGILSTVEKTRAASELQLIDESLPRVLALQREGVTTLEIKSGYGLNLETERKMLRVARQLNTLLDIQICTTFLGAHAIPKEFKGQPQAYVDYLCDEMLPIIAAENLADAVDVFCESIGFTLKQCQQIFEKALELNLPIKCHSDQLSNLGASELAASMGALSVDHLEYLKEKDALAMAKKDTVAVLLPGAFYFLGETKVPPIDLFRKHGIKMAIATDSNPGSSPTTSLLLMMSMACRFFKLTVPETVTAVTHHAAKALGLQKQRGSIKTGFSADLIHWSLSDPSLLCYYFGYPLPHKTMIKGKWLN